ncbi:MAG TPA: hypothetical protein VJ814_00480 [Gaiellaceae bacterium]|nr:hypothetical protein [Gaiellaceae bacterium]
MPSETRVEAGRRRARAAKRAVTLTAAAGFAVVLALARQGHPATSVRTPASSTSSVAGSTTSSSESSERDDDSGSTLGGGSLSPPSSASHQASTHTS